MTDLEPLPPDVERALAVERCRPGVPPSSRAALLQRLETEFAGPAQSRSGEPPPPRPSRAR